MLTSMLLGAALAAPGAPVPATADPAPAGPAPWVLYLKADDNGRAQVLIYKTQTVTQSRAVSEVVDGKATTKIIQEQVERVVQSYVLVDNPGTKFATAAGRSLTTENVMKQAKAGVVVLVSADGKPVSKSWLRAVDPETIVVTADALVSEATPRSMWPVPTAAPRLVLLGTDSKGKVQTAYNPAAGNNNGGYYGRGGGRVMMMANGQQMFFDDGGYYSPNQTPLNTEAPVKGLEEVPFEAYDLTGRAVSKPEAMKRLTAGGYALIAGDSRIPDESYLKHFRGDLLVLVSQDLMNIPVGKAKAATAGGAVAPAPAPAVRPVPVLIKRAAIQAIPAQAIPLQAAPLQAIPLKVAPAVEKEVAPPLVEKKK